MHITKISIVVMSLLVVFSPSTGLRAQELPDEPGELEDHASFLKLRPGYQDCLDKAAGVVPAMIRCNDAEYSYQDKRLNAAYKKLVKKAGTDDRKALVDEERGGLHLRRETARFQQGLDRAIFWMRLGARSRTPPGRQQYWNAASEISGLLTRKDGRSKREGFVLG